MPKIAILDTYYPQFLDSWYVNPAIPYEEELQRLLHHSFGTADFYSRNLGALGWDAVDIIVNGEDVQARWAFEHCMSSFDAQSILAAQIAEFKPDVIFSQNLSLDIPKPDGCILAGQCSCPWPGDANVRKYDLVFTSFPHYVERIDGLGVKAVYLPLAFDPIVLERAVCPRERIYDCVFVGGIGRHWKRGQEVLEAVARQIPTFLWWGYGVETLPKSSALREKYRGPAWGLDYYKILLQSKLVLNRHGEIAQGYANNLRMFEATGCGAFLVTEEYPNMRQFFDYPEVCEYANDREAVDMIAAMLDNDNVRLDSALMAQRRTMTDHTYASRMKTVSEVLTGMLCHA